MYVFDLFAPSQEREENVLNQLNYKYKILTWYVLEQIPQTMPQNLTLPAKGQLK